MLSQSTNTQDKNKFTSTDIEPQETLDESDKLGFTRYAEVLHGRLAMIGFILLLALAILSKHGLINLVNNL